MNHQVYDFLFNDPLCKNFWFFLFLLFMIVGDKAHDLISLHVEDPALSRAIHFNQDRLPRIREEKSTWSCFVLDSI